MDICGVVVSLMELGIVTSMGLDGIVASAMSAESNISAMSESYISSVSESHINSMSVSDVSTVCESGSTKSDVSSGMAESCVSAAVGSEAYSTVGTSESCSSDVEALLAIFGVLFNRSAASSGQEDGCNDRE